MHLQTRRASSSRAEFHHKYVCVINLRSSSFISSTSSSLVFFFFSLSCSLSIGWCEYSFWFFFSPFSRLLFCCSFVLAMAVGRQLVPLSLALSHIYTETLYLFTIHSHTVLRRFMHTSYSFTLCLFVFGAFFCFSFFLLFPSPFLRSSVIDDAPFKLRW